MKVVITETQSLAQNIAQALNIDAKPGKDGFLCGRGYTFVWMSEELVGLSSPEDYGIIRFLKKDLPFTPLPLTLSERKRKSSKGMVTDQSAVRQIEVLSKIFERSEQIIVAMQPNEKGELAFRRLNKWIGCDKPYRRLWLHSLLPAAIREGFRNLQNGTLFDNLFDAADCRSQADFLIGVNASAAFSLATGIAGSRLGRLEMPVLAMICKSLLEYRKFVPAPYYRIYMTLEKDEHYRQFFVPQSIMDKEAAENIYSNLKSNQTARITKVESQNRFRQSPLLYNLTDLQIDACTRYGFTAQKTMGIAGQLFERNLITFPGTDSRCISENLFPSIPKLLRQTACYSEFTDCLDIFQWDNLNRHSVEDETESLHHALIPTGVYPGFLSGDSKTIYRMIVARTLEAFAPDCRVEDTHIEVIAGECVLESKQSRILFPGWRAVLNRKEDRDKDEIERQDSLPVFTEGESVPFSGCAFSTCKTKFPVLHTEATLLEAMKKYHIGIPASRASLIETLIEWKCIERKEPFLRPAEKGLVIYHLTKNMRISDVETTAGWEQMLKDVGNGKQHSETFLKVMEIFTRQATEEILRLNPARL